MESSVVSSHYSSLGQSSFTPWWAAPSLQAALAKEMLAHLLLSPTSRLVDLGAGSGTFAAHIQRQGGLTVPLICVDPSRDMLAKAGELEGLETLCMSGEDWAAAGEEGDTDRVVIKAAVHHFDKERMAGTLAGIRRRLSARGRLVVEKACSSDEYTAGPYPQAVIRAKRQDDAALTSQHLQQLLLTAGFTSVEVFTRSFPVKVTKEHLFEGFHQRELSAMAGWTDSQIEEGIKEVDAKYEGDFVDFNNTRDFIVAAV